MTIENIRNILPEAWTPRANYHMTDLFNGDEPAVGQCAVTALVLQDYFGGEIVKVDAYLPSRRDIERASHYFNIIDGKQVDLTNQQFSSEAVLSELYAVPNGFSSVREYALSFPDTVKRYKLLKSKVDNLLKS